MLPPELNDWYNSLVLQFETSYLASDDPWHQSGYFGSKEIWDRLRRPIADCVGSSGSFLDIGCANGYLLECLIEWVGERGLALEPWGLDLSSRFIELARSRLPSHADQLQVGNAFAWSPPRRFDYVRTGLYAPRAYERRYLRHLLDRYLSPGGRLLVAQYRGGGPESALSIDQRLEQLGFAVDEVRTAADSTGNEGIRIAVVEKKSS